jgi:hypothetical protein
MQNSDDGTPARDGSLFAVIADWDNHVFKLPADLSRPSSTS